MAGTYQSAQLPQALAYTLLQGNANGDQCTGLTVLWSIDHIFSYFDNCKHTAGRKARIIRNLLPLPHLNLSLSTGQNSVECIFLFWQLQRKARLIRNSTMASSYSILTLAITHTGQCSAQCVVCTVGFPWSKNSPGDATKLPSIRHHFWGIFCIAKGE